MDWSPSSVTQQLCGRGGVYLANSLSFCQVEMIMSLLSRGFCFAAYVFDEHYYVLGVQGLSMHYLCKSPPQTRSRFCYYYFIIIISNGQVVNQTLKEIRSLTSSHPASKWQA